MGEIICPACGAKLDRLLVIETYVILLRGERWVRDLTVPECGENFSFKCPRCGCEIPHDLAAEAGAAAFSVTP